VSIWFGNGDFTFDQVVLKHYSLVTSDLTTGDVNQDGFTDLLVSFFSSFSSNKGSATGGVDGFYGSPTRTFAQRNVIAPNSNSDVPFSVVAVDINGDGINDLAAADQDTSSIGGVFVWLGNPDGSFQQTPVKFNMTSDGAAFLVAGDFNRDGRIDIATVVQNTVEVLLNATPRSTCQAGTADPSMTICQPQDLAFSNSPLEIHAEGKSSKTVTDINVYVDNKLEGEFPGPSMDRSFSLPVGNHFVVVTGFDSTGAHFSSDRHVTIYTGAPGETCATGNTQLTADICLPEENATLSSPVQVLANSYSPDIITSIQVYIDNQLQFNDTTATEVNKLFPLAPGPHLILVKAWDAFGGQAITSRNITVK
jgi:hypothetical protein